MSKGPQQLERFIFWSRWLQAPLYLGLIVAQGIYVYLFMAELGHLIGSVFESGGHISETETMLVVLGLIDVVDADTPGLVCLEPDASPYRAAPLLRDTFRYGNLEDPRVYADYFIQYNLSASHARDAFARVAKELLRQNRVAEAVELLDLGLERMPTSQVRFTDTNTYPFLEAYYAASAMGDKEAAAKGDALLREYAQTLIEYIEHYLRFEGAQGDMVSGLIDEKLDQLGDIYYLASYADRKEVVAELNDYYRSLGVSEENLIDVGDKRQQPDSALLPAAK